MKRLLLVLFAVAAAAFVVPSSALAVNPHEVPSNPIICTVVATEEGPAVECAGAIAGLGTGAVIIRVDVALA